MNLFTGERTLYKMTAVLLSKYESASTTGYSLRDGLWAKSRPI